MADLMSEGYTDSQIADQLSKEKNIEIKGSQVTAFWSQKRFKAVCNEVELLKIARKRRNNRITGPNTDKSDRPPVAPVKQALQPADLSKACPMGELADGQCTYPFEEGPRGHICCGQPSLSATMSRSIRSRFRGFNSAIDYCQDHAMFSLGPDGKKKLRAMLDELHQQTHERAS